MNDEELRGRLVVDGFIASNSARPSAPIASPRPWFVNLLLGCSGWLAGIFVVSIVGILFKPTGVSGWLTASAICFGSAYAFYAIDKESAFLDQLALMFSITAQVLFLVAVTREFNVKDWAAPLFYVAVLQSALVWILPNRLAKILSTLFAVVAWTLTLRILWWGSRESLDGGREQVDFSAALMAWIIIWVPVAMGTLALIRRESLWMSGKFRSTLRPMLTGLLLCLCFATFASQPVVTLSSIVLCEHRTVGWLAFWPLLSIAAALFALFAAHRLRNTALMGAAAIAVVMHISQFYYVVGVTLLMKSLVMGCMGIVCLIISWLLGNSTGKEIAR